MWSVRNGKTVLCTGFVLVNQYVKKPKYLIFLYLTSTKYKKSLLRDGTEYLYFGEYKVSMCTGTGEGETRTFVLIFGFA